MVEMRVLTTLLSILLVSNTRVTQSQTTPEDEQPSFSAEYNPTGGDGQVIQCSDGNSESNVYIDSINNRYVFRSTNFGIGNYGYNTFCKVKFVTSSMCQRLTVYYSAFHLERGSYCYFDYLCVNGERYCSSSLQGRHFYYHIPANSSFTFVFKTDWSIVGTGFKAHLTFDDALSSNGSYEATSGDGSHPDTVENSCTDTSYQDRCASGYRITPTE